jgi:hypothetical protein
VSNKNNQVIFTAVIVIAVVLWIVFSGGSSKAPSQVTDGSTEAPVATDVADTTVATPEMNGDTVATSSDQSANASDTNSSANGSMIADSGFDVKIDGFSFENYGNAKGVSNLKANDMRRMFGDKVCTRIKNDKCTLTSPARQWMKEINAAMDGGHCEGMAVTSLTMFHKIEDPNTFGAPKTNDLAFDGNTPLQETIAYWWATQSTEPTMSSMITGKPSDIIKLLAASLSQGQNADTFYSIGIYMADGTGGHAVTPVSITDLGDGKVGLNIYDNNWPNELRTINVDTNAETWSYQASTNPDEQESLYSGDTLELTPSKARLETQDCDFCGGKGSKNTTKGAMNTFILSSSGMASSAGGASGMGTSLFVTPDNKRIGYQNGKLINEIPGASVKIFRGAATLWSKSGLPVFRIPKGVTTTLQLANDPKYKYSVTAYGDGKVVKVSELDVSATKASAVYFGSKVGSVKIKSAVKTTPDIYVGDEENASNKDSATQFSNVDISEDGEFDVTFDEETDQFTVDGDVSGDFDLDVIVSDENGDYTYSVNNVAIDEGANIAFDIDSIDHEGDSLTLQVDENGDGTFDTQSDVTDDNAAETTDPAVAEDSADN